MNILIFGTGTHIDKVLKKLEFCDTSLGGWQNEIIGFLDNNKEAIGKTFYGKSIYNPAKLDSLEYDVIVIGCTFYEEIQNQLVYGFDVPQDLIRDEMFLLQRKMYYKYKDVEDSYIQETLQYWKTNKISVFNQYNDVANQYDIKYEVSWDKQECMPYVMFEGKRMYYPRSWKDFEVHNGKQYINDILYEQKELSPHLYLKKNHKIRRGGVIVDAGVGEGNFALRYIDVVSKVYLIENDPEWLKALQLTFAPFKDKVVFCNKKLSNTCGTSTCTLDEVIQPGNKIDFIKMDIEGDEILALMGAKRVFSENQLSCSICTYHKKNDEYYIRKILEYYGCQTSFSQGYMVFTYDPDIYNYADFRKGVIYGEKC